jgi:subtilisin-like proprotein convertase family protein
MQRGRRILILALVAAVSGGGALAAPGAPRVTVVETSPGRLEVTIDRVEPALAAVDDAGRTLVAVTVPGCAPHLVAGEPDLPVLPVSLAIPGRGEPRLEILAERWREVPPAGPVLPSRGNLPRTVVPSAVPLAFGPAYRGGVHPAEAVRLDRPSIARDVRGVVLQVWPVRWDADRDRLLVLEAMTVAVVTEGEGGANPLPAAAAAPDGAFASLHAARFVNPPAADKYRTVATGGRLLVIAPAAFVQALEPWLQWKRERGFDPLLQVVEQAGGTADALRDSVMARFAEPEGLTYVVLAGDVPLVPGFQGEFEGADDDTRYAQVAGDDLYPDLFVSRISARDVTELETQLAKFIAYERDPEPGGAWYGHALGAASNEGQPTDAERADALRLRLLAGPYAAVDRIYQPDGTAALITAALHEGRSLVNYLGHGSGSSWVNPPFGIADVHALANGRRLPWIIDVSCANGNYSDPECFAEAWLRTGTATEPAGAIAMYASSTTTPWVPPTVMQEEVVALIAEGREDEIGALCTHGIMKVLDAYPGDEGRQLVEQYNIFGDCTLQVRTAAPRLPEVVHEEFLAPGVDVFPVRTGVAGARVAVTSGGVLHGTAVTDATGFASVPLLRPVEAPGWVVLTVTGRDLLTRRETVPVHALLDVALLPSPSPLQVGQTGSLEVDIVPAPGWPGSLDVELTGWGVERSVLRLDGAGTALFAGLEPRYGEDLRIEVRNAASGQVLYQGLAPVTGAADLPGAEIQAQTEVFGMLGAMAPEVSGSVAGWASLAGLELRVTGCGVEASATTTGYAVSAVVRPDSTGVLTVALLRDGSAVHEVKVPVIEALGLVDGVVVKAGDPDIGVARARVVIRPADEPGAEPVFDAVTDEQGRWRCDPRLPAGDYRLTVSNFGYITVDTVRTVRHGDNAWATALAVAPRVAASGIVRAAATGQPLGAEVEFRRADDLALVGSDIAGADGAFVTLPLPVGAYKVLVTAAGFVPRLVDVVLAEGGEALEFALEAVGGSILVADANLQPGVAVTWPERTDKLGRPVAVGYTALPSGSGLAMVSALFSLGYAPAYQPRVALDPSAWRDYDVVILARGDHADPLPAELRDALLARVAAGGRVLTEGGDLAAAHRLDPEFLQQVLGTAAWAHDRTDTVDATGTGHPAAAEPAPLFGVMDVVVRGYADGDALVPAAGAAPSAAWSDGTAAAVARAADPEQAAGRTVHFGFTWDRLGGLERSRLLQNAVEWLLHPAAADAAALGRVLDAEGLPVAGATVWLAPGGPQAASDAGGSWFLGGLLPGTYRIGAAAPGFRTAAAELVVPPGGTVAAVDLVLAAGRDTVFCSDGGPIPDDAAAGVLGSVSVGDLGPVGAVTVTVEVDHPWPGDVELELIAPSGARCLLQHADGRPDAPAGGLFAGDLAPAGDLRALVGKESAGTWLLRAADRAAGDAGELVGWCLELGVAAPVVEPPEVPTVLAVIGARPNPFNPTTTIRYALPRAGAATLAVYDLRGRLVRVLASGHHAAAVHETTWDGADASGRTMASGTYLLRLDDGRGAAAGKVMLLR